MCVSAFHEASVSNRVSVLCLHGYFMMGIGRRVILSVPQAFVEKVDKQHLIQALTVSVVRS